MKIQVRKILTQNRKKVVMALALLYALVNLPSAIAQTFYSNIPDFYQHQRKGPVKNRIEDPTWEVNNVGANVGWCLQASTVNQFWFFKKKGYNTLIDDAIGPPPDWLPAVSDAISDLN
jgi:hypothetical protein